MTGVEARAIVEAAVRRELFGRRPARAPIGTPLTARVRISPSRPRKRATVSSTTATRLKKC